MGNVLVRDLDDQVIEKLKARARTHHRSLQAEAKNILERVAKQPSLEDAKRAAIKIRRKLSGRKHSDSADLLSEDRRR